MDGKILIVGGYGSVGKTIAIELGERFPGKVIVAGRDYQKAQELAQTTGMKILPLKLDVINFRSDDVLPQDISLVVMCVDALNLTFVRKVIQQGIYYVDISATYEILSQIELLDYEAKNYNATVVLSVGLAPGLTNLLSAHCFSKFEQMERADIFILLGLGEAHGEASIRWTIDNLNSKFSIWEEGITKLVASFEEWKQTTFPHGIGTRAAYRFNFSDQHVIPKTLNIPSVSTWLCFDSTLTTRLFALWKRIGLFGLLRFKSVRELIVKIVQTLHFGSDTFVVKVNSLGTVNGVNLVYECAVSGHGEGQITAMVTSEVVASLFATPFSHASGVFHIEQLFNPNEMIAKLEHRGLKFISSSDC